MGAIEDWSSIEFLRQGTAVQQAAYASLQSLGLLDKLRVYSPVIIGTIPIDIDIPGSDIDVACHVQDFDAFEGDVRNLFSGLLEPRFKRKPGLCIVSAQVDGFEYELYGSTQPVEQQNGFRHMCIEHRVLGLGGSQLREKIRRLKLQGVKTEPAFAQVLGLGGDPYAALLEVERWEDADIIRRLNRQ